MTKYPRVSKREREKKYYKFTVVLPFLKRSRWRPMWDWIEIRERELFYNEIFQHPVRTWIFHVRISKCGEWEWKFRMKSIVKKCKQFICACYNTQCARSYSQLSHIYESISQTSKTCVCSLGKIERKSRWKFDFLIQSQKSRVWERDCKEKNVFTRDGTLLKNY